MALALAFVPRLRPPMEALDLGTALLRAHRGDVYRIWALQLGLLLAVALPFLYARPLWILPVLWWLLPWFDRGTLFVLSRKVFGQEAGLSAFLDALGGLHRRGLAASLLWRRPSRHRTLTLAVFVLEGLDGRAYRQRCAVLARASHGTLTLLAFMALAFTAILFFGSLLCLQLLVPSGARFTFLGGLEELSLGRAWFLTVLGLGTLALVAPFHLAAGFALYLNRRTQLEGWDLEVAFRAMASRVASRVLLVLALLLAPAVLRAEAPPANAPILQPQDPEGLRARRILKEDPAFGGTLRGHHLEYRPDGREPRWLKALLDGVFGESKPVDKPPAIPAWVANLDRILAFAGRILLVALGLGILLWLLLRHHHRTASLRLKAEAWEGPEAVAGLDIRPDALPPDIPAAARARFRRGQTRAALSLLYRGALSELVLRRGLQIPPGATEGDCLRGARRQLDARASEAFRELTRAWQLLAYGGGALDEAAFEGLLALWGDLAGGRP